MRDLFLRSWLIRHSLFVMAVPGLDPGISPGHPDRTSAALQATGITGTRPMMT
jgi:hypothetical protein